MAIAQQVTAVCNHAERCFRHCCARKYESAEAAQCELASASAGLLFGIRLHASVLLFMSLGMI